MSHSVTSINPATGEVIWETPAATHLDIDNALTAAKSALEKWRRLDFIARAQYIEAFAKQVDARQDELVQRISFETGKPLWESKTEVNSVIAKVKFSIQAYHERNAEKESHTSDVTSRLRYKPHGVIAVLGPFNFPAHLSNGHIVPALLAGNTVIYKPSELTPFVAQFIMECWQQSGIPTGVINCIQGGADCAKYLLDKDIQGVYFTGSYTAGLAIHRQFSDRPDVLLALEMGGNNPLIIDEIDDIDAAVYQTLLSTLITAGQRCTCARRVFIPSTKCGDAFLEKLFEVYQTVRVGPFTTLPEPFMGPVIRPQHAVAFLEAQNRLIHAGGIPLLKMALLAPDTALLSPGLIDMTSVENPDDDEIFAPFTQIYRYQEFEEALQLANRTQYGLAAGLFSNNPTHFDLFMHTIRAGLINWNRPTTGAASNLPFGGVGHSGNHRPSAYFAADYCSYPVASQEQTNLVLPENLLPGIETRS